MSESIKCGAEGSEFGEPPKLTDSRYARSAIQEFRPIIAKIAAKVAALPTTQRDLRYESSMFDTNDLKLIQSIVAQETCFRIVFDTYMVFASKKEARVIAYCKVDSPDGYITIKTATAQCNSAEIERKANTYGNSEDSILWAETRALRSVMRAMGVIPRRPGHSKPQPDILKEHKDDNTLNADDHLPSDIESVSVLTKPTQKTNASESIDAFDGDVDSLSTTTKKVTPGVIKAKKAAVEKTAIQTLAVKTEKPVVETTVEKPVVETTVEKPVVETKPEPMADLPSEKKNVEKAVEIAKVKPKPKAKVPDVKKQPDVAKQSQLAISRLAARFKSNSPKSIEKKAPIKPDTEVKEVEPKKVATVPKKATKATAVVKDAPKVEKKIEPVKTAAPKATPKATPKAAVISASKEKTVTKPAATKPAATKSKSALSAGLLSSLTKKSGTQSTVSQDDTPKRGRRRGSKASTDSASSAKRSVLSLDKFKKPPVEDQPIVRKSVPPSVPDEKPVVSVTPSKDVAPRAKIKGVTVKDSGLSRGVMLDKLRTLEDELGLTLSVMLDETYPHGPLLIEEASDVEVNRLYKKYLEE